MRRNICALVTTVFVAHGSALATTWHVDDDAPAGGDGQSWPQAFNSLQAALNAATVQGDVIFVAQGTYLPDPSNRFVVFGVKVRGLQLIGGFIGFDAPDPSVRNFTTFKTILSGDINGNGVLDVGDSRHVLTVNTPNDGGDVDITQVIDGFTITGGWAEGNADTGRGAGILIGPGPNNQNNRGDASPTIRDCIIEGNHANRDGAGIGIRTVGSGGRISEPRIERCTIRDNDADTGAGIASRKAGAKIIDCQIHDNQATAGNGGGVLFADGNSKLISTTINDNDAENHGGGVAFIGTDPPVSQPQMINCLVFGNTCQGSGGGVYSDKSTVTLVNSTIVGNQAGLGGSGAGGGYDSFSHSGAASFIRNCIFWGNTAPHGAQISVCFDENDLSTLTVEYSDVQGCWLDVFIGGPDEQLIWCTVGEKSCTTCNLDQDPLFANAGLGNYRLKSGSPAIDKGSTILVPRDEFDIDDDINDLEPTPDRDIADRVNGPEVDMGAYEHVFDCPADLTGDQVVDVADLLEVLANWGGSGPEGDVNLDGIVDTEDLLAVLANWGPCGAPGSEAPPQSVQDCLDKFGNDPVKLQACIETMIMVGTP